MYTFEDINKETNLSKDFLEIRNELSRTYIYNNGTEIEILKAIAICATQYSDYITLFDSEGRMYSIVKDYIACIVKRQNIDFSKYVCTKEDDKKAEAKLKEMDHDQISKKFN